MVMGLIDLVECPECGAFHGEEEVVCHLCREMKKLKKEKS